MIQFATRRLKNILSSGLAPRALLATICIGGALALLPIMWGTTLLCAAVGHRFRLNHVVLQSVNYLIYPVQLALIIPYYRLGARLFPWGPPLPAEIMTVAFHGDGSMVKLLAWGTLKAVAAWLVTTPLLALLLHQFGLMILNRKPSPA